ncbi:hypothetical protein FHX34_1011544 [Actinoplanes teichomyceticus]|uniref:Uncharacterized protein n=1 Tax=Actinoplanes teichomyceticus TaxID=1867 RepID=A0A561WRS3_ACTTI|nr:hypothetical protein FHX34_1011544 [Actinoplanes teichomyceticus]
MRPANHRVTRHCRAGVSGCSVRRLGVCRLFRCGGWGCAGCFGAAVRGVPAVSVRRFGVCAGCSGVPRPESADRLRCGNRSPGARRRPAPESEAPATRTTAGRRSGVRRSNGRNRDHTARRRRRRARSPGCREAVAKPVIPHRCRTKQTARRTRRPGMKTFRGTAAGPTGCGNIGLFRPGERRRRGRRHDGVRALSWPRPCRSVPQQAEMTGSYLSLSRHLRDSGCEFRGDFRYAPQLRNTACWRTARSCPLLPVCKEQGAHRCLSLPPRSTPK